MLKPGVSDYLDVSLRPSEAIPNSWIENYGSQVRWGLNMKILNDRFSGGNILWK